MFVHAIIHIVKKIKSFESVTRLNDWYNHNAIVRIIDVL